MATRGHVVLLFGLFQKKVFGGEQQFLMNPEFFSDV